MPRAAQRMCVVCKAPCIGRTCAAHAEQDPERERDRFRGSASSRGYGRRHEKWRKLILNRDPLCRINVKCSKDLPAPSTVADHIIPLSKGGSWRDDNGQGCCEPCHNWKRSQEARGGIGVSFLRKAAPGGPLRGHAHTVAK